MKVSEDPMEKDQKGQNTNVLEDLDVDRVDGVDNPATGRPFIFMKDGESDDIRVQAENLAEVAGKALLALQGTEGIKLAKDAADALNELAQLVGIEAEFAPTEEAADETPAEDEPAAETPATPDPAQSELVAAVKAQGANIDRLASAIEKMVSAGTKVPVKPAVKPVSKQAAGQDPPADTKTPVKKELGKGMFTDVVFGGGR